MNTFVKYPGTHIQIDHLGNTQNFYGRPVVVNKRGAIMLYYISGGHTLRELVEELHGYCSPEADLNIEYLRGQRLRQRNPISVSLPGEEWADCEGHTAAEVRVIL